MGGGSGGKAFLVKYLHHHPLLMAARNQLAPKVYRDFLMKHEEFYSISPNGPRKLAISWNGEGRDMIIKLEDKILATIPNKKEIMAGQEIILPDGVVLSVKLVPDFWNSSKLTPSITIDSKTLNPDGTVNFPKKSEEVQTKTSKGCFSVIFIVTWIIVIGIVFSMKDVPTSIIVILLLLPFIIAIFIGSEETNKRRDQMTDALVGIPDFTATQHVFGSNLKTGLALDETKNKICLITRKDNISHRLITYKDLISAELFEDGISVTKTARTSQVGGALVGGLMLGGVGAIIGGLSGKTVTTDKVERIELRLTINDTSNPLHDVTFMELADKKDGIRYKAANQEARKWLGIMDVLIKRADIEARATLLEDNAREQIPVRTSIADELRKLADLRSAGILTEEEFQTQKRIALSQNREA